MLLNGQGTTRSARSPTEISMAPARQADLFRSLSLWGKASAPAPVMRLLLVWTEQSFRLRNACDTYLHLHQHQPSLDIRTILPHLTDTAHLLFTLWPSTDFCRHPALTYSFKGALQPSRSIKLLPGSLHRVMATRIPTKITTFRPQRTIPNRFP